ncbi:MAG: hypothetical protein HFG01_09300 [Oscillibacter sp.]|jgi:type II secretory pathway pseudopilin PulG|nr:hypothetical protein [Oscillibacter sp.]
MREKLQSTRGETLVEALAAILICALSVALLFSAVMASARMDRLAQEAGARYYQDLTRAERQSGDLDLFTPPEGAAPAVTVESSAVLSPVTLGQGDGLRFYGTERLLSYAADPLPVSGEGEGE